MNRLFVAPVVVAALLLLLAGAATLGWIWLRTGRPESFDPVDVAVCLLPLAALVAAVLAWGSDRANLAISVWVVLMLGGLLPLAYLPVGELSTSSPARWPYVAGYGAAYLVGIGLFMFWLASWAARLPAPSTLAPISGYTLRERLLALDAAGLGLEVMPGDKPDELVVNHSYRNGKRRTRIRLWLQPDRLRVVAKEYWAVAGDSPIDDGETRMHHLRSRGGSSSPNAQLIYSSDWAITMPRDELRRRFDLRLIGNKVQLPPEVVEHFKPKDLPQLLAELVHRSGWSWQGVFFFWQAR